MTIVASAGGPTTLRRKSKVGEAVGANCHCEFQSFESTVAAINKPLSASLLHI
jgi:hypothetical protein